jgi:Spy/CpxP family protein refolding chaperone
MKTSSISHLLFGLALVAGIASTQVFSQDDGEKPKQAEKGKGQQRPQGQGGQGGQRGGQQGGPDLSNLSPEEQRARLNKMIQERVVEMAEAVEIREDQQEKFVKTQAKFEVAMITSQGQMRQARQEQDRNKMNKLRQASQKANADLTKEMKGILDKEQFKVFQAKLKERMPQQGQRPGGGGGGGGGGQR